MTLHHGLPITFLALSTYLSAGAAELWVAPTGSDDNPGTKFEFRHFSPAWPSAFAGASKASQSCLVFLRG